MKEGFNMFRKILEKIDYYILSYITEFSLIQDWYLPHFGEKRPAFADGVYGHYIEGWFYPVNHIPYSSKFYPEDLIFLDEEK
jgi:hypothetical protein